MRYNPPHRLLYLVDPEKTTKLDHFLFRTKTGADGSVQEHQYRGVRFPCCDTVDRVVDQNKRYVVSYYYLKYSNERGLQKSARSFFVQGSRIRERISEETHQGTQAREFNLIPTRDDLLGAITSLPGRTVDFVEICGLKFGVDADPQFELYFFHCNLQGE